MNESEDIESSDYKIETKHLLKFLIPSLIGLGMFLLPIPKDGTLTIIVGIVHDWLQLVLEDFLPYIGMGIVSFSGIFTLIAVTFKPSFVKNNDLLNRLFIVGPVWYVSRAIGAVFIILTVLEMGPEFITSPATGGTPAMVLIPILVSLFLFMSFVIALLTDFGLMEYIGTLARKIMKPLFTIPGRAAIDSLASWLGSPSVGVIITRGQHEKGYYSDRGAAVISTTFSLVGIGYIYVMASVVGLPDMYFQLLFSTYIVSMILAIIMPRIWPLSRIKENYYPESGKKIKEEQPEGIGLHTWAVRTAVEKAKSTKLFSVIKTGYETLGTIYMSALPLVMAWGTLALIVAEYTPIFDWISYPFGLMLHALGVPEAFETGTAFVLAYPDQFLAGVVGSTLESPISKFMAAGISITGLIYLSEIGVLILDSTIPLDIKDLTIIYFERAFFSVILLAPFAYFFVG
ncbi:MAG: YjiH family protein [Thermoplasmatota archaeon]